MLKLIKSHMLRGHSFTNSLILSNQPQKEYTIKLLKGIKELNDGQSTEDSEFASEILKTVLHISENIRSGIITFAKNSRFKDYQGLKTLHDLYAKEEPLYRYLTKDRLLNTKDYPLPITYYDLCRLYGIKPIDINSIQNSENINKKQLSEKKVFEQFKQSYLERLKRIQDDDFISLSPTDIALIQLLFKVDGVTNDNIDVFINFLENGSN